MDQLEKTLKSTPDMSVSHKKMEAAVIGFDVMADRKNGFVFFLPIDTRRSQNRPYMMKILIPKTLEETKEAIPSFEIVFRKYDEKTKTVKSSPTVTLSYPPKKKLFSKNYVLNCETNENFHFTKDEETYYYSMIHYDLSAEFPLFSEYEENGEIYDLSIKVNDVYYHKYYFTIRNMVGGEPFIVRDVYRACYSCGLSMISTTAQYDSPECQRVFDKMTKLFVKTNIESHSQIDSNLAKVLKDAHELKDYSSIANNIDNLLGDSNIDYEQFMKDFPYTIFHMMIIAMPETLDYLVKLGLRISFYKRGYILEKVFDSKPNFNYANLFSTINAQQPRTWINEAIDAIVIIYGKLKKYQEQTQKQ